MDVIGANVLSEYGAKHPSALPTLEALHALIAHANWTGPKTVEQDCGGLARFRNDGCLVIDLRKTGCRVTLSIHYGLGIVRILEAIEL
jgi:mRNA-degrading endonuclease HigB of HigAB toxin-antitoxin module